MKESVVKILERSELESDILPPAYNHMNCNQLIDLHQAIFKKQYSKITNKIYFLLECVFQIEEVTWKSPLKLVGFPNAQNLRRLLRRDRFLCHRLLNINQQISVWPFADTSTLHIINQLSKNEERKEWMCTVRPSMRPMLLILLCYYTCAMKQLVLSWGYGIVMSQDLTAFFTLTAPNKQSHATKNTLTANDGLRNHGACRSSQRVSFCKRNSHNFFENREHRCETEEQRLFSDLAAKTTRRSLIHLVSFVRFDHQWREKSCQSRLKQERLNRFSTSRRPAGENYSHSMLIIPPASASSCWILLRILAL